MAVHSACPTSDALARSGASWSANGDPVQFGCCAGRIEGGAGLGDQSLRIGVTRGEMSQQQRSDVGCRGDLGRLPRCGVPVFDGKLSFGLEVRGLVHEEVSPFCQGHSRVARAGIAEYCHGLRGPRGQGDLRQFHPSCTDQGGAVSLDVAKGRTGDSKRRGGPDVEMGLRVGEFDAVAECFDAVDQRPARDAERTGLENRSGLVYGKARNLDLGHLDRIGETPEAFILEELDEPTDSWWADHLEGRSSLVHGERSEKAGKSENVVAVKVGDEDASDPRGLRFRAHQLKLGAFAAVDQDRVGVGGH
jgi:hypothetical protein